MNGGISELASAWTNAGPKGMPIPIFGYSAAMLYQKSSCTSTGVPRKNQMYSQLPPETSGLGDSRMTDSTSPSTTPIAIAMTVSSSVTRRPSRMRSSNR